MSSQPRSIPGTRVCDACNSRIITGLGRRAKYLLAAAAFAFAASSASPADAQSEGGAGVRTERTVPDVIEHEMMRAADRARKLEEIQARLEARRAAHAGEPESARSRPSTERPPHWAGRIDQEGRPLR